MKFLQFILPFLATLCGCATSQVGAPPVVLEIRTGSKAPAPGFEEITPPHSTQPIYVSQEPALANGDVSKARASQGIGWPQVEITFTERGATKFGEITGQNIGQPLAIFVDGQLLSAPVIREKISGGKAIISGHFTEEEAKRIAKGIASK